MDPLQSTDCNQDLAHLFEVESVPSGHWTHHELQAILEHQLKASIIAGLGCDDDLMRAKLDRLSRSAHPPIHSFDDLLHHPEPPLELLEVAKRFAKSHIRNPHSAMPAEIATFLYYATTVVALTRCGQCITSLSDAQVKDGVRWLASREWVSPLTRRLLLDLCDLIR